MVFSLFGRKDKSDTRRGRGVFGGRAPDSTLRGPVTTPSVEAQRELARRTAEKIDRIESEMIDAPLSNGTADSGAQLPTQPMPSGRIAPLFQPPPAQALAPQPRSEGLMGLGASPRQSSAAEGGALGVQSGLAQACAPAPALAPLEFEPVRQVSQGIEISVSALPADLEEAAILYANGQAQAAAATLKASVARGSAEGDPQQAWRMLFDVLQSIGARTDFETVALQYAARLEKSPPAWQEGVVQAPEPRRTSGPSSVAMPATLDAAVHARLETARRALANRRPVTLDFAAVRTVDPQGAALVVEAFAAFVKAGSELTVTGAQALAQAARGAIEVGRRDPGDACWQLALLALRLLGERQAFDDLSIDFCITYEVSPPSWELLPGGIQVADARGAGAGHPRATDCASRAADVGAAHDASAAEADEDAGASAAVSTGFPLRGEIVGRMLAELKALREWAGAHAEVAIDCRALRRLDFVAAGELLNEVVTLSAAGRRVRFVEPGAMVEALLVVMGIHELADIRRRRI